MKSKSNYNNPDIVTQSGREATARAYEYLKLRIINQWDGRCPLDRSLIEMQANYGLVYAMNHYREGTSQSFAQYAAYCMKNMILNGINEFSSTVRISHGQRDKMRKNGETTYNTVSIDENDKSEYTVSPLDKHIYKNDDYTYEIEAEVADHDRCFKKLIHFVNKNFDKRTRDIFYSTYHLNRRKLMKGSELAKKYGVSTALISQSNHHVIDEIRKNKQLCELLDAFRPQ